MNAQSRAFRLKLLCGLGLLVVASVGVGVWRHLNSFPTSTVPIEQELGPRPTFAAQDLIRAAELNPAKQKMIWDAEQTTFELETQFGKPFAKALAAKDAAKLGKFLRDDFAGEIIVPKQTEVRRVGLISSERFAASTAQRRSVDGSQMVAHLLDTVARFQVVERSKIRVLKIHNAESDTNRWETKLLLTAAGRDGQGRHLEHVSEHLTEFRFQSADEITNQGHVVARWSIQNEELRVSEKALLEEVTESVGLHDLPITDNWKVEPKFAFQYRFQIGVEDFNRDGFPDIAVALDNGNPLLLQSVKGERFEEITPKVGLKPWTNRGVRNPSYFTGWIDYNNDGFPDLIMGHYFYENRGGTNFVDVTESTGLSFGIEPMGCVVADYDCDGWVDLYILYQNPETKRKPGEVLPWVGDSQSGAENHLWRNLGNGRFMNVTQAAHAGGGRRRSFAASWLFFDEDRFPDLYVANDFGENVLLRNRGDGTFEDITKRTKSGDYSTSMGLATGDIDNDGNPEIYVANMFSKMGRRIIAHVGEKDYPPGIYEQILGSCAGNRMYSRKSGETAYKEFSEDMGINQVGWAYAPAMVDLDGDGLLDIYAATGFLSFDRSKPDG
ncbi:MAG: VCBS repeat-containing protein [Verrucomicrobiota bacterium]